MRALTGQAVDTGSDACDVSDADFLVSDENRTTAAAARTIKKRRTITDDRDESFTIIL